MVALFHRKDCDGGGCFFGKEAPARSKARLALVRSRD